MIFVVYIHIYRFTLKGPFASHWLCLCPGSESFLIGWSRYLFLGIDGEIFVSLLFLFACFLYPDCAKISDWLVELYLLFAWRLLLSVHSQRQYFCYLFPSIHHSITITSSDFNGDHVTVSLLNSASVCFNKYFHYWCMTKNKKMVCIHLKWLNSINSLKFIFCGNFRLHMNITY